MISLQSLTNYLNDFLTVEDFQDYCPNGLQVQGKDRINKVVCGVTASQALIRAAIEQGADAMIVHHGYFWKGDDPCVIGLLRERLALLLKHNISLLAYHLPLDVHASLGNNVGFAQALGIEVNGDFVTDVPGLGWKGSLPEPCTPEDFASMLSNRLKRQPLHIRSGKQMIQSIAWCTGAAQDFITAAAAEKVDAYVSGEVSERTTHLAKELGVDYFAAGHHATERFGVQAISNHLNEKFSVESVYIEIDNPV